MKVQTMHKTNSVMRTLKAAAVLGAAFSLTACATMGFGTPEEIVSKSSKTYWDARIKGDAAKAYGLTNAAYQQAVTLDGFKKTYPGTFAVDADVHDVKCEPQKCEVGVNLKTNPPLPGKKIGTIDVYSKQTWLLEDGQWRLFMEP